MGNFSWEKTWITNVCSGNMQIFKLQILSDVFMKWQPHPRPEASVLTTKLIAGGIIALKNWSIAALAQNIASCFGKTDCKCPASLAFVHQNFKN